MSKDEKHDHEYRAVTYKVQEAVVKHWHYEDHLLATLEHERVKLFCVKCGDTVEPEALQPEEEE